MNAILAGRSILIVEDEPVIAMDIVAAFERAGARVLRMGTLRQALLLAEKERLSAAVLDYGLSDGDSSRLCERLKKRYIPFMLHSGYSKVDGRGGGMTTCFCAPFMLGRSFWPVACPPPRQSLWPRAS
jgi:DNA-binding response OmpR family regulator